MFHLIIFNEWRGALFLISTFFFFFFFNLGIVIDIWYSIRSSSGLILFLKFKFFPWMGIQYSVTNVEQLELMCDIDSYRVPI